MAVFCKLRVVSVYISLTSALFAAAAGVATTVSNGDDLPSFASYITQHGRAYAQGTEEYEHRRAVFEDRLDHVRRQNSQPSRRWSAAVNHLSDRTDAELAQLRGLRVMSSSSRAVGAVGVHGGRSSRGHFLGQITNQVLPEEKLWTHLKAAKADTNQDACGSCWAVATSTMLQANSEINGYNRTFSAQELVSCAPNPFHCGGTGGCDGSTVEMAMGYTMDHGLTTSAETPYAGVTGTCKNQGAALLEQNEGGEDTLESMIATGFHAAKSVSSGGSLLGIRGWTRLPQNEYEPLMRAVAETGPVAISVAASGWQGYGAGVFDDCQKDATIDHAVVLLGYGTDKKRNTKYWTIKNSWGTSWGEEGNIRLLRHEGNEYCGTDWQPKVGTGCDGGPTSVPVCGMCGILYDSVVAHFHKAM